MFGDIFGEGMLIIAAVLGIVIPLLFLGGAIAINFLFLSRKNGERLSGFAKWLYDFLRFDRLLVETILRIIYIALAMSITVASLFSAIIALFDGSIGSFFLMPFAIVLINLILRVIFEFLMMQIITCRNTSEINDNLKRLVSGGGPRPDGSGKPSFPNPNQPFPGGNRNGVQMHGGRPQISNQSEMVVCKYCGKLIKPNALFCPHCGRKKDWK